MDELLGPMDSMYFHHRAFTRVLGMEYKPPSILTIADDPNNTTAAIANRWHVTDGITFGVCNFDNVLFTFDIATVHRKDGPLATVVHLCPEQIVQLCLNNVLATLNASLLSQFEGMQLLDSVMVIDPDEIDYDVFDEFGPSYGDEPSTSTASASTSGVQDVEDVV
ncbi:hypothetical protein EWM64_g9799 [Hericium alpestre]|uniref:Uncharacterized protein n=1 Tax=Hericium alpestre TaxID=135208 RepID=A0A4Y9ZJZ3_9AGAM|nr:hypothetical protein EWM64_g9799 [Hericium alpestre]